MKVVMWSCSWLAGISIYQASGDTQHIDGWLCRHFQYGPGGYICGWYCSKRIALLDYVAIPALLLTFTEIAWFMMMGCQVGLGEKRTIIEFIKQQMEAVNLSVDIKVTS